MKICCWFHSIHLRFHRFANPTSLLQLLFCVAPRSTNDLFYPKMRKTVLWTILKKFAKLPDMKKKRRSKDRLFFGNWWTASNPKQIALVDPLAEETFFHANSKRIVNGFFDSFSTNLCQPHSENLCLLRWERLNQPQEVHWVTILVLHFSNSLSYFQTVTICHRFTVSFHPLLSLLHLHFLCKVSQDSLTIVLS